MKRYSHLFFSASIVFSLSVIFGGMPQAVHAESFTVSDKDAFIRDLAGVFGVSQDRVRALLGIYQATQTPTPTPSYSITTEEGKLSFLQEKFDEAVRRGEMTRNQQRVVIKKLKEYMDIAPNSSDFAAWKPSRQQALIADWKNMMDPWLKTQGLTLNDLRRITGKGNKFLMGIYY